MRCIFCKANTSSSSSVEHIVPESLGNKAHTLPVGVVCDGCNNYLACKVEKPVLDSGMFRLLRADREVTNKRGRTPELVAGEQVNLPDYRLMSRFLGKVGLEALASRVLQVAKWNEEMVDKEALDELRRYVRFNKGTQPWPFAYRTLYPVNAVFREDDMHFEVLHEHHLLYTTCSELYIVVAIFGVEFSLNLGGPHLDGYRKWLEEHNYESPLYQNTTG
jgi:hypothetical protein